MESPDQTPIVKNAIIACAACEAPEPDVESIGGLRRTSCRRCGHSQRLDIEPFDYGGFAMGRTGVAPERLEAQAAFVLRHVKENARALEIGCAGGDLARVLKRRLHFETYDGVEISPARETAAGRLNRVFGKPLSDLLDTGEIEEKGYDIILSSHHLEHIEDPFAMIGTMTRATKAGGLLFIETPDRSGHSCLPFDDNRSHIHFFCATSLTRILARCGLDTLVLESGARHDARYPDCLRVIARLNAGAAKPEKVLSAAAELAGGENLVVWGAGRMVDEVLAHYFDPSLIAFFVDKDVRKHGGARLGAPVRGPEALEQGSDWRILINSIEMEDSIREEIGLRFGSRVSRVIGVRELLDRLKST